MVDSTKEFPVPVRATRRALIAAAALAAGCLAPHAALAADYCVATSGCDAAHTFAAADLQTALDDAATKLDPDRVLLGPGHYAPAHYIANLSSGPVEIAGAGSDQTVFDVNTVYALIASGPGVSIHDIGVVLAATPSAGIITNGLVSNVSVKGAAGATGASGLVLGKGASVAHATVTLPAGGTGIRITDTATVVDSTVAVGSDGATSIGVLAEGSTLPDPISLKRLRISAGHPLQADSGQVQIADSLLDLGATPFGVGLLAHSDVNGPSVFIGADRVTIVGHDDVAGLQTGAEAAATGVGATVGVTLENSVIANVRDAAIRSASAGYAHFGLHHTVYTPGAFFQDQNTGTGTGTLEPDGVTAADPRFVDAAAGDYRPRADSALIDASAPASIALGPTDLAGLPRLVDGNGDGSALADLGAFEYQRTAPAVAAAAASPAQPTAGQQVTFSGTATDADPGELLAGSWAFGDGSTGVGLTATHAYGAPGSYTATFTATDPVGLKATRSVTIDVAPAAAIRSGVTKLKGSGLKLSGLRATPSRFHLAGFLPARAARKAKGGTTIRVRVSAKTTLTLRLLGRHGRTAGLLHVPAHAGVNAIRFGGRLTRKSVLAAGSYRLVVSAPSAKPVSVRLTVLR